MIDQKTANDAKISLKPIPAKQLIHAGLIPEWLVDNLLIEIGDTKYTLKEFLQEYWRIEAYADAAHETLIDVMEALTRRFDITDEDRYSPDESAALIASGHIKQRDDWTPED